MFDLSGQVAVVTGGGKNIGARYCRALAEAGAAVAVADIDGAAAEATAAQLRKDGFKAVSVVVDVADEESVNRLAQTVESELGPASILVNNAALFLHLKQRPFWEIPTEEWHKVMAVNVVGIALVTKAFLPQFRRRGRGKVINIASSTVMKGRPNRMHYVASKGAVIAMTRAMARELGNDNINVNCIAPGQTVTEGYREVEGDEYFNAAIQSRAIKRLQTPEDLLGTIVYLASSASDFMTGQTLVVDGGSVML